MRFSNWDTRVGILIREVNFSFRIIKSSVIFITVLTSILFLLLTSMYTCDLNFGIFGCDSIISLNSIILNLPEYNFIFYYTILHIFTSKVTLGINIISAAILSYLPYLLTSHFTLVNYDYINLNSTAILGNSLLENTLNLLHPLILYITSSFTFYTAFLKFYIKHGTLLHNPPFKNLETYKQQLIQLTPLLTLCLY